MEKVFEVEVQGRPGRVWGIAPGKIIVQMRQGSLISVNPEKVQPLERRDFRGQETGAN